MANIVKPVTSELYYCVVDDNGNKIISVQKLSPPATLVDNSDDLISMTGVLRGNCISMTNYWINNLVDINGFLVPDYIPHETWEELTANKIDAVLKMDLLYYELNPPTGNVILDLSSLSNDPPIDGGNNQYILQLIALFSSYGFIYTVLIAE